MIFFQVANSVENFFLPVNADKPNFVPFLVFVVAATSLTTKISSFKTVVKREAILNPMGANQNAQKLLSTNLVNTNRCWLEIN